MIGGDNIENLRDLLSKYQLPHGANAPASFREDFPQMIEMAPAEQLALALSLAFRTNETSFPTVFGMLYQGSPDRGFRSKLINFLLPFVPEQNLLLEPAVLNTNGLIDPGETDYISDAKARAIASAVSESSKAIDELCKFLAQEDQRLVLMRVGQDIWSQVLRSFASIAERELPARRHAVVVTPNEGDFALAAENESENRQITVTGHSLDGSAVRRFNAGETYRLRFRVGPTTAGNLVEGDASIKDVPKGGLKTHWVLASKDVEFVPQLSEAIVQRTHTTWMAEFDLLIPEFGSSKTRELAIIGSGRKGSLLVMIYAVSTDNSHELYREVLVDLSDRPSVTSDETTKVPWLTHLPPVHEWTTPDVHIEIASVRGLAKVTTKRAGPKTHDFSEPWNVSAILGELKPIRKALEAIRESQDAYFNDLENDDITARLATGTWKLYSNYKDGWQPLPDQTDERHKHAFDRLQRTSEWQSLASAGYDLFNRCFPTDTKLRNLLEELKPGSRIDFHWTEENLLGLGSVAHIPWALMHMKPGDPTGETLANPEDFLGLRFRIGSQAQPVKNGNLGLGALDKTHSIHLLYWGNRPDDEVAAEAQWQVEQYKKRRQSRLLPDSSKENPKRQIILALDEPGPSPVGVLYFYCHCSVGDGTEPILQFGNTSKAEDVLKRTELSQKRIPDAPIVFANACSTVKADHSLDSALERSFFDRGARAFIGTETKVPGKLASKFAWLFFEFFYRQLDPKPMSAGEALTQTRVFLWTQYKNIGGLFYSLTNQYDLYLASDLELLSLRR